MADIKFPRSFCPLVKDYTGGDMGGVSQTDVEGGSPRFALDYDRGVQPFTVTLALTREKYRIWALFYHRIIKRGAVPFDMPLDSGFGTEPHTVNIVKDSYSESRTTRHRFISFTVLAEPKAYDVSVEDAQAEIDFWNEYGERGGALLNRLAIFANQDVLVLQDGN